MPGDSDKSVGMCVGKLRLIWSYIIQHLSQARRKEYSVLGKGLHKLVLLLCVSFLLGSIILSCALPNGDSVTDLMTGAVAPPDEIPETTAIHYMTDEGQAINVTAVKGQVILLFDSTVSKGAAEGLITVNGASVIAKIPSIGYYLVSVEAGDEMGFISIMRQESSVSLAIPNVPLETCQSEPPDEWSGNDWFFSWHLEEIRADLAWELLKDVSLSERRIVFIENFWGGAFNGLRAGLNDFQGRIVGTIPAEIPLLPSEGHGTMVAAVATALGNNGYGNVGVAWRSNIGFKVAYTVFDVPFLVISAADEGANVINLALGLPTCFAMQEFYLDPLFAAVNTARALFPDKQFLVTQAAGNDGCELVSYERPVYNPKPDNLVLVGATDTAGMKVADSNFGDLIDIAAPGTFSIYQYSTEEVEDIAGTSFAAPLVAGGAALVWSEEPDLNAQELVQRLKDTAQPFSNLESQYEGKLGAGILDVYGALGGTYHSLTIASTEGGEVTNPGEGVFPCWAGEEVSLVAEAEGSYHFVNWTGDVGTIADVNNASTTVTMNDDYSITANFEAIPPVQYDLTISSTTGGNVTTPGEGPFTYDEGTVVELVATPDAGYQFVSWTGDVTTIADVNASSTTITMGGDYSIITNFEKIQYEPMVTASGYHTVGLSSDGTIVAVGYNGFGQCNVGNWTDVTQVAAGYEYTVGVRSDGTLLAAGDDSYGQCDVGSWTGITQVAACECHTVGLRSDGTVVAVGGDPYGNGHCNVDNWTDIIQVSAGLFHTVGLKPDGTVVAVGYNEFGQCNVGNWTDIVQASAGYYHTIGLRSDGTVIAVGHNAYGECNIGSWTDIIQVSAGGLNTVGLSSDGTVVAVGWNNWGQCNVGSWADVIQVTAGYFYTAALKSDGTVVAVGMNGNGQCDVGEWDLD